MKLRVGTRGSKLALRQVEIFRDAFLKLYPDVSLEIVKITTKGDKITDAPLSKIGTKGVFVKEIEEALIRGEIELAVHSLKDMPSDLPEGLILAGVLKRESPLDVFISDYAESIFSLKEGIIGTSSLRRKVIIKRYFPRLTSQDLRGNLDTRIRKMKEGLYSGIIVSYAGLIRMNWENFATEVLPVDMFVPSGGQGVIAIECREKDREIIKMVEGVSDRQTSIEITAERAFLKIMGAGCQVPMGVNASVIDGRIEMVAFISDLKAERFIQIKTEGMVEEAENLGRKLGERILEMGGRDILREIYETS
jgi:hydroxymethylbilane synthase